MAEKQRVDIEILGQNFDLLTWGRPLSAVRSSEARQPLHNCRLPPGKRDLVVMTVQILKGPDTGYKGIAEDRLFTSYKQLLFTHVVAPAEKEGKPVHLLVVPSSNIIDAIALTAAQLGSAEVIDGPSPVLPPEGQAKRFRKAWEKLRDKPKHQVCFRIIEPDGNRHDFRI